MLPFQVEGNGNCLFLSIKKSLQVRHSGAGGSMGGERKLPYFPNWYFRRQVIAWMIENCQWVQKYMGSALRATYGVPDPTASHGGPFSYKTYLIQLMEWTFWSDKDCRIMVTWSMSGCLPMSWLNKVHVCFSVQNPSDLVASTISSLFTWLLAVFLRSLVFSVRQENLVKDVTVCQDIRMSEYKVRHPDDSEDPQDVGLSSRDEATGMEEVIGVARRIVPSRPSPAQLAPTLSASRSTDPDVPEGCVKLAGDEVVIKKAVLQGIKRGAELALRGQAPASFSLGQVTAGDLPFKVPAPAVHQVFCDLCHKDFPTSKALRHHLRVHKGLTRYLCSKCGKHLASSHTWEMHKDFQLHLFY